MLDVNHPQTEHVFAASLIEEKDPYSLACDQGNRTDEAAKQCHTEEIQLQY